MTLRDVPRLPDQWVARVVVGHGKDGSAVLLRCYEGVRLFRRHNHRLVTHHVESRIKCCARDRVVHVIRRHNADHLDALIRRE